MRTRMGVKKRQQELFPDGACLPEICMNFRMALNGSGDPLPAERVAEVTEFLKAVVATWSFENYDRFDHAVFSMVSHVLEMAEKQQ